MKLRKPKPSGFGSEVSRRKKGVPIAPERRTKMGRPKVARTKTPCWFCEVLIELKVSDRRLKQKVIFCSVECMKQFNRHKYHVPSWMKNNA